LHLWHPMLCQHGVEPWVDWKNRLWENQDKPGRNGSLAARYSAAFGDVRRMRRLVEEGRDNFITCA